MSYVKYWVSLMKEGYSSDEAYDIVSKKRKENERRRATPKQGERKRTASKILKNARSKSESFKADFDKSKGI